MALTDSILRKRLNQQRIKYFMYTTNSNILGNWHSSQYKSMSRPSQSRDFCGIYTDARIGAAKSRAGLVFFADMRQMRKGRVSSEMTVYFNSSLKNQSQCQEKPGGIQNI